MPQDSSVPFTGAQGRPLYPSCARIPTPPAPKVQRKASPALLPLSSVAHQEGTHGLQTKFVSANGKVNPPAGQRVALRRASKKPKEGSAEKMATVLLLLCPLTSHHVPQPPVPLEIRPRGDLSNPTDPVLATATEKPAFSALPLANGVTTGKPGKLPKY